MLRNALPPVCLVQVLLLTACATPGGEVAAPGPALDSLANMPYTLPDGREVSLEGGSYQEKPFEDSATFVTNLALDETLTAFGDLNDDGVDDAAVVLIDAPGGSGTFVHLAAVVASDGGLSNAATSLLGDRVRIEGIDVADGTIELHVVVHGPDDPLCCPSELRVWGYELEGDALVQTKNELLSTAEEDA